MLQIAFNNGLLHFFTLWLHEATIVYASHWNDESLSEYLRMARGGEDILINDRGEVIVTLRQLGQEALMETPYSELVQFGSVPSWLNLLL